MSRSTFKRDDKKVLLNRFFKAVNNYDKMRGFHRALTVYCKKQEKKTGTSSSRFRAAFKMLVTKNGGDSSLV
jgi:hypothetical protein